MYQVRVKLLITQEKRAGFEAEAEKISRQIEYEQAARINANFSIPNETAASVKPASQTKKIIDLESIGLPGRWESKHGNFVLRPMNGQEPSAVIHFIGNHPPSPPRKSYAFLFILRSPIVLYRILIQGVPSWGPHRTLPIGTILHTPLDNYYKFKYSLFDPHFQISARVFM